MAVWDIVKFSDVAKIWRYDAEYWQPIHVENEGLIEKASKRHSVKSLYNLVRRITGSAFYPSIAESYSTFDGVPFIRVADIGAFFVKQSTMVRIPYKRLYSDLRDGEPGIKAKTNIMQSATDFHHLIACS